MVDRDAAQFRQRRRHRRQSALSQSQSILDTATSAINSVITTINSIQTALTEATNPGADLTNINTTLASLGQQLTDAVNGASFNGLNVLDGSTATARGGGNASPATAAVAGHGYNVGNSGDATSSFVPAQRNPAGGTSPPSGLSTQALTGTAV